MLLATVLSFGISGNLLYFISKAPEKEGVFCVHSILFLFATTIVGISILYLAQGFVRSYISFDFIGLLLLYVFFYVNLDLVESYFLAKKRSDYVFVYSGAMVLIRVTTILISAYYTQDPRKIIITMTVVEAAKFLLLAIWWKTRSGISWLFDRLVAKEQLSYIVPIGAGTVAANISQRFGGIFVAASLGPSALAIYSIGVYQIPVISIVRSAVSDVIFPDMVQRDASDPHQALELWKRANIAFCFIVFPIFTLFFVYAEQFIVAMFTRSYINATPVFQVMLIMMVRLCFEVGTPLRARNKNGFFLKANIAALILNVILTLALFGRFELMAPAIAMVVSDIILAIYLAWAIIDIYSINIAGLFMWKKAAKLMAASMSGVPVLLAGLLLAKYSSLAIAVAVILYLVIYIIVVRMIGIEEAELIISKVLSSWRKRVRPG